MFLIGLFALILGVSSVVITDSGCSCATVAAAANGTGPLGCASKLDWSNQTSKWCLTDKTVGTCGNFYTGFGYVDSCSQAGFPSVNIVQPTYLEWDQAEYTFYTGQTIVVNWTSQNIASNEWLKIAYATRTLTTGSGVNVTAGSYAVRISDGGTSVATNVSVIVSSTTSPAITANSIPITVIQSKISYVSVYDGATLVGTGGSIVADGRNVTIKWRGLGQAGVGIASVTVKSTFGGGGGTTVGTAVTGLVAQGNMTVNYIFPRGAGGFGTYTAQISVQSPGVGVTPYTLSSNSFSIAVAPTQTPTSSTTPSATPTPSLSLGASASITPSRTPTPSPTGLATPSSSPTVSGTPTQTPSGTASITASPSPTPSTPPDLAAIAAAASQTSVNLLTTIIGASIGGICLVCLIGGAIYRVYQHKLLQEKRMRRLNATRTKIEDRMAVYGVSHVGDTVTYTPQRRGLQAYRSNSSKMSSV